MTSGFLQLESTLHLSDVRTKRDYSYHNFLRLKSPVAKRLWSLCQTYIWLQRWCDILKSTIPAKKFRSPFSCHFTIIGCTLTFIVIAIDVCKLKFEIYYCHL
jgi:hypothetical protein